MVDIMFMEDCPILLAQGLIVALSVICFMFPLLAIWDQEIMLLFPWFWLPFLFPCWVPLGMGLDPGMLPD